MKAKPPSFVISCHADTGFRRHGLVRTGRGILRGHLDNFAGVHAVMRAFFTGRMDPHCVRIELTHGEETDFAGAIDVRKTLNRKDMVAVVDVTGTPTKADITIEKCMNPKVREFVEGALTGIRHEIFEGCPDPVSDSDETDVYRGKSQSVFFLGIPCQGGDYNKGTVRCRERSIEAASRALVQLANAFAAGPGSKKKSKGFEVH
jgi:hypothetical protein